MPQTLGGGQYEYQTANIYAFSGIDRISSPMMLEATPQNIYFFPFIITSLLNAINVIDDESGAVNKRWGGPIYLDNPDSQPIQNLLQFTSSSTGISQQLRVSGNHIYRYTYSGGSWGSAVKTLSGNNIRMRHTSLNGYLHLTNGVDPLMYYDGTNFNNVVNGAVTTTLTTNVATTDVTINVASTSSFNQTAGYLVINGGSEILLYTSTDSTHFYIQQPSPTNGSISGRGYAGTTPASYTSGQTVAVYFGTPPANPKIVYSVNNRLWAFNLNIPGGGSAFQVASARGRASDSTDYIITTNSTSTNGVATGTLDPGSSQIYYLAPDDGQQITGVNYTNGTVIVAKGESLFTIQVDQYGNPASWQQLSGQWGTLSHESMVNLGGQVFFYNQYGAFASDSSQPQLMTYQVNDLATGIPSTNLSSIFGIKHNFTLMYSIGSTTESLRFGGLTYNNAVLVYNYLTNNWFMWQYPFTINCYSEMFDSTGTLQLFYGDTNGNTYVFTPNIFADGTNAIPILLQTRYFFFKNPVKRKDFRTTTGISENGTAGTLLTSILDDREEDFIPVTRLPNFVNTGYYPDRTLIGRGIAYKVTESSTGDFRFKGIQQEYEEVGF